jgi:hypothetical protein
VPRRYFLVPLVFVGAILVERLVYNLDWATSIVWAGISCFVPAVVQAFRKSKE